MSFAVDTGGTFTDLIVDTGSELYLFKAPTTAAAAAESVLDVLAVAAAALELQLPELLGAGDLFIHGTTRAINALVTSTAARTAFLTTAGHPDILLFREGGRSDPFNFAVPYPEPLVPRALTFEVPERVAADGAVLVPLDETRVIEAIDALREAQVQAVGVALLWSIVRPEHELRVGELLEEHLPGVPYTLSHRLNPTLREYRRASSTCIDASLKPLMTEYFESLEARLAAAGFRGRVLIVTSQGGMLDAADVAQAPIHSINSGPSMAPVAGRFYSQQESDHAAAIVVDSGGTTFDVSVVQGGRIPRTRETWLGPMHQGHITGFPSVDVSSIGAGGGSIAWVDDGGLLRVGPQSAGSEPGPACYGHGGDEPTLTDACLLLGYIDPGFFLGGAMRLDVDAARAALEERIADPLGLGLDEAAAAVVRITTENMVHAIEEITVNQGIDPREAVLVGGGGAAGLNVVSIARRLGCGLVLIPETGAALSAAGGLLSDLSADYAITHVTNTDAFDYDGVDGVLARLQESCTGFVRKAGRGSPSAVEFSVEARYPRQIWELEVPLGQGRFDGPEEVALLAEAFHRTHEQLFAISEPDSRVEIVTWRACARVPMQASAGRRVTPRTENHRLAPSRPAWFPDDGWREAALVDFETLADGSAFAGPAIVESSFTTVVVDEGARARKTERGTLAIDVSRMTA